MAQSQAKKDYYPQLYLHNFTYFISQVIVLLYQNQETSKWLFEPLYVCCQHISDIFTDTSKYL